MYQDGCLRILLCEEPEYGGHFEKAFRNLRSGDYVLRYFAEPQNLLAQATLYEVDIVLVNAGFGITQSDMPESTQLFCLSDHPEVSGREIFKYQSVEEILKIIRDYAMRSEEQNVK